MNSKLVFQNSYWLILLCIAIGIGYAWFLYSKKTSLQSNYNKLLGFGRALLVATICFLLLNPLLKSNTTRTLKPVLVLGIDNSKSISQIGKNGVEDFKSKLADLVDRFSSSEYDLEIRSINELNKSKNLDSLVFNAKSTDFGSFFRRINEEFSGQNLRKVVLVSDGMGNAGLSPLGSQYSFQIDAVGLGDTTAKKDIAIKGLTANKLAYLGNSFPIEVDVLAKLYLGRSTTILIRQDSEIIDRKIIAFNSQDDYKTVSFQLNADKIGKQSYSVEVLPLDGESNIRNNKRELIIDVVDGKEKILLVSLTPHPDTKALKSIIDKNPLFELTIKNIQSDDAADIEKTNFDLLILHQLPDIKGEGNNLTTRLLAKFKPTMFFLGAQTNISRFNGMQEVVGISGESGKTDKVTAQFNSSFGRYISEDNIRGTISKLPPVIAPFGEYKSFPGSDIILYQKVGSVLTDRALLATNTNAAHKAAVFTAEGIWQWRMEDYLMNENHDAVDDYILKTLQLISVKEDKVKLRVYTTQIEIDIDESVVFKTEAYDDLYERIYKADVNLSVQGPAGYAKDFNYIIDEQNASFEISNLSAGVYNFQASAMVLGEKQNSTGQFIIRDKDLEFLNTTADFDFLRTLAQKNGGKFYSLNQLEDLAQAIQKEQMPSRLINTEDLREIINLKWLLPLLLLLVSLEWALRKYFGTY